MKKALLSVLAGLTVIGSAVADGPSVEDRKKLCQLLIDKGTHVWAEKTSACIPVNPCAEDVSYDIQKVYCINYPVYTKLHLYNNRGIDTFMNKYAEKALGTTTESIKKLSDKEHTIAVKTADDGYYVAEYDNKKEHDKISNCTGEIKTIAKAYGKNVNNIVENSNFRQLEINISEQECKEMKDFANLLYDGFKADINYTNEKNACVFDCHK